MTPPYGRKWRGTKEPFNEGWKRRVKSWLKTQHSKNEDHGFQSHHFMANRWETMETVTDFIFLCSKITADSDCSHELKRHLLLERKAMTNLDSYYKAETLLCGQRSIHIVKPLVFRVVVYGCESWTVKSVEHWITDSFELWCWRRLLRVPLTGRRSNQATLKKINLEYSLEELMLKLKLPMLWPPDAQSWFIRKDPDAGKDWSQEKKGATWDEMVGWRYQLNGHEFE